MIWYDGIWYDMIGYDLMCNNIIETPAHKLFLGKVFFLKKKLSISFYQILLHEQSTVSRKRESMELFETSKNLHGDDKDSSVAKILRERSTIAASMRSINDVIRYVWLC